MKLVNMSLLRNYVNKTQQEYPIESVDTQLPIVVVGSGPVGLRFVQAFRKRNKDIPIIFYGKEPWEPYNRVKLSSLLSGEIKFDEIKDKKEDLNITTRLDCEVKSINTFSRYIVDSHGGFQSYSKLVLATGSNPHMPNIKGIESKGVYTFRNLTDAQSLFARQTRTRKVVVIGGGLLGLEAARAMQRNNTKVTIIEHENRFMSSQLDDLAAEFLHEYVLSVGIQARFQVSVKEILSNQFGIRGVLLSDRKIIECDTVIISTGINPNISIARDAHISIGRGIRVNDQMQTSDPNIYAIGECCEHRGKIYGLVAPGFEQSEVAAHSILKGKSRYEGSIAATNLKVMGKSVFSIGEVVLDDYQPFLEQYKYFDYAKGVYRKIVIKNKRIVAAVSVGEWREQVRIQSLVENKNLVMPWQVLRFKKTGNIFADKESDVVSGWPSNTVVCNCTGRTRGELSKAIINGCDSINKLMDETGASTVCGSCKPLLQSLLGSSEPLESVKFSKTIGISSIIILLTFLLFTLTGSINYNLNAETIFQWDFLWRNSLMKQITGFTILGLSILAVLISLRKRSKTITFGDFDTWRAIHILISLIIVIAIIAHTGFRLGNNLNYYLMVSFVGMLSLGSLSAISISVAHKFDTTTVSKIRSKLVWSHIILFWPVPVLLTFHVLKSYYF